jgi:hypothetical protein
VEPERCPGCGEPTVVIGHVIAGSECDVGHTFAPRNCRPSWQAIGVAASAGFRACVSCGHVWNRVDPARLREYITSHGEELARQELDEIDYGIYRDLPDLAAAREVAEKVAAVDALVRRGRTGGVGLYRELKGVTWDQALHETGRWARLSREEKLALFGWQPKKKVPVDDLDSPYP